MVRSRESEIEALRKRMLEAAERVDRRLGSPAYRRLLPAAFALGLVLARVPAARTVLRGGLRWLLPARVLTR